MPTYKIVRVSTEPAREHYSEQYNTRTFYIKVMLEGHEKPVSIGKKTHDALKAGDTVNGTILPTEHPADNFKAEFNKAREDTASAQGQNTQDDIRAQWAIKQAVLLFTSGKDEKIDGIEKNAKDFFSMVERVKSPMTPPVATDPLASARKIFRPDEVIEDGGEPINLDDISF